MKVYYRLSDGGYKKEKPSYITNENCLNNFLKHFGGKADIELICDNVTDFSWEKYQKLARNNNLKSFRTNGGSSAAGCRICFEKALNDKTLNENEIIYFCEGDYIHREGSYEAIIDGIELGADIITPYNHPDKFIPASKGGNPTIGEDGAQITKVFRGKKAFWMLTDSTTCTWATKLNTLRKIEPIIKPFISETYPKDMAYFHELRKQGYSLIQPIPTFATHAEILWLSPLIGTEYSYLPEIEGWKKIIEK